MIPFVVPWKKTFLFSVISALFIFVIFKTTVNLESFLSIIRKVEIKYFWLSLATIPPTFFMSSARWYFVMRTGRLPVSFKELLIIVVSSASLAIIPGRLGDFARSYPLRHKISIRYTVGAIVLEKIMDICVLLLFSSVGLWLLDFYFWSIVALIIAVSAIPLLVLANKILNNWFPTNKLAVKIQDAASILTNIKTNGTAFFWAVISSIINWTLTMAQFYWLILAVQAIIPVSTIFAFLPLGLFAGLVPFTLAGVGTRDAAIIYLFKSYILPSQALSAGILYSFQSYGIESLICLPLLYYFFRDQKILSPKE